MSPEEQYGKTFWCDRSNPTLKLKVVDVSSGGGPTPVTGGAVTFQLCEDLNNNPVDWPKCGVLQKRKRRDYQVVDYAVVDVNGIGVAEVTLTGWMKGSSVWGMRWEYDKGDGRKPEAEIKWFDLAHVNYTNPPLP
jgi:hypothetical protein